MTYSYLELLIFFNNASIDIYCLEFISDHIKEILYKYKLQRKSVMK